MNLNKKMINLILVAFCYTQVFQNFSKIIEKPMIFKLINWSTKKNLKSPPNQTRSPSSFGDAQVIYIPDSKTVIESQDVTALHNATASRVMPESLVEDQRVFRSNPKGFHLEAIEEHVQLSGHQSIDEITQRGRVLN